MSYYGYAMEAIGLLLIAFAFVEAYGLYSNAASALAVIGMVQQSSNQGINATLGRLSGSITDQAGIATYTLIEIAILFLFVNMGYKLVSLGMQVNKTSVQQTKQQKA